MALKEGENPVELIPEVLGANSIRRELHEKSRSCDTAGRKRT